MTDGPTVGQTDGPTDRTGYRDASTHLKIVSPLTICLTALQDSSHALKLRERQKDVGLADLASAGPNDNSELATLGLEVIENYVKAYLRTHFPNLPEGVVIRALS